MDIAIFVVRLLFIAFLLLSPWVVPKESVLQTHHIVWYIFAYISSGIVLTILFIPEFIKVNKKHNRLPQWSSIAGSVFCGPFLLVLFLFAVCIIHCQQRKHKKVSGKNT